MCKYNTLLAKSYYIIGSTSLLHYWQFITLLALLHFNYYVIGSYYVIGRYNIIGCSLTLCVLALC